MAAATKSVPALRRSTPAGAIQRLQGAVPAGIAHVYGATCDTPDCRFHESLHAAEPGDAIRTAVELGWYVGADAVLCPLCVNAVESRNGNGHTNGHKSRRAAKAVRS
jgi:hypothetical protein